MSEVDQSYGRVQGGDHAAYAEWVALVELPLRRSLRSFARSVDVEAVVQEGLLRMWVLAPQLKLSGENASLRYASTLMRNLARNEAKRMGVFVPVDPMDDSEVDPSPPPNPELRRDILGCLEKIPSRPRHALMARLDGDGQRPDRDLAARLGMQLNTFLKNIGRARQHLARCLESRGWSGAEFLP